MKPLREHPARPENEAVGVSRLAFEVLDLGPFDGNRNNVLGLNDAGQLAGVCFNERTGRVEAFQQQETKRSTMLGTLGGSFSMARGVNNRDEVVGGSLTKGDESFHGFLFRDHRICDLNDCLERDEGWEVIQALGINNLGEIVGLGSREGQDRLVLLRPRL
jgi:probable HAF family extracellular repeat protein